MNNNYQDKPKPYAIGIDIYGIEHEYKIQFLNSIWCHYEKLKSLKVYDEDNKLNVLYCHENQLEELTIIGGQNIVRIDCENNNFKNLDISMCENLHRLWCDIDLENNIKLSNNHELNEIHFK